MGASEGLIGRDGKPIRALAFAGGGFSTALQLGVAHALMVNRGRPPDIVAGISAGAVNAVALAEILQAGGDRTEHRERQVACFRVIFEAYRGSPGAMAAELLPDSLQIDTRRPLEPMKLPIHVREEREFRDRALHSRSGLMNVYNKLLGLRLPIGTIARVVRRVLGIRYAKELEPRARRTAVSVSELLHLLNLAGLNLPRLAPLGALLFPAAARSDAIPPEGGTAGELISRSLVWEAIFRGLTTLLSFLVLITLWPLFTVVALLLAALVLLGCGICLGTGRARCWWKSKAPLEAPQVKSFFRRLGRALVAAWKLVGSLLVYLVLWGLLPWGLLLSPFLVPELEPFQVASAIAAATLVVLSLAVAVLLWLRRRTLILNILRRNAIANALLDPHPVRELFVRLFDRSYYGRLNMDDVVEAALHDRPEASTQDRAPKRLGDYARSKGEQAIRLGVVAANVATGKLEALPEATPVVDALLAATAVVPLFDPIKIAGRLYVDGTNVANEVSWPLIDLLKDRIPEDPDRPAPGDLNLAASSLHIYGVSPLQLSRRELELDERERTKFKPGAHVPLVDAVARAMKLQRFRDATIERRLTELHTRLMGRGDGICFPDPRLGKPRPARSYLRTWAYPIEPDRPLAVDRRLLESRTEEDRRTVIAETVASGCRAAMERMLLHQIRRSARGRTQVSCTEVIGQRLGTLARDEPLPGSDPATGPGLSEVCRYCKLIQTNPDGRRSIHRQCLSTRPHEVTFPPDWPSPRDEEFEVDSDPQVRLVTDEAGKRKARSLAPFEAYKNALRQSAGQRHQGRSVAPWPAPRTSSEGAEAPPEQVTLPAQRPTISLLFSGGVFRGVFQVGVINALSELDLRPDLVAGASIGSITGAMTARLFSGRSSRKDRCSALRRLAATYMAVDRLVLTDRFADFVRTATVRAAQARFSLNQLDRFTRLYDQPRSGAFSREARTVMAGLERLFYVSPFELRMLLQAIRYRKRHRVVSLLREYFQEWLERGGVGDEILGAEPLSLLITEHVLEGIPGFDPAGGDEAAIGQFLEDGIVLLATSTNYNRGRLEILGQKQLSPEANRVSLHQAMLASSAFPGVFRPRWSWEVFPNSSRGDLLADGGVMDNLPFDAVAEFLDYTAQTGLIEPRPDSARGKVPHLIFTASLRPDPRPLDDDLIPEIGQNWPALTARTHQLGYNRKLTLYEDAQRSLRRITNANESDGPRVDSHLDPVSLEVVTVRPNWVCGTFAFHPMLGFRRSEQARSIAHGCASTLWQLGSYAVDPVQHNWLHEWKVDMNRLPALEGKRCEQLRPLASKEAGRRGRCWFNEDYACPFSSASMEEDEDRPSAARQISAIHHFCGLRETHARRD